MSTHLTDAFVHVDVMLWSCQICKHPLLCTFNVMLWLIRQHQTSTFLYTHVNTFAYKCMYRYRLSRDQPQLETYQLTFFWLCWLDSRSHSNWKFTSSVRTICCIQQKRHVAYCSTYPSFISLSLLKKSPHYNSSTAHAQKTKHCCSFCKC